MNRLPDLAVEISVIDYCDVTLNPERDFIIKTHSARIDIQPLAA